MASVTIDTAELLQVLVRLDELVVGLDRVGSSDLPESSRFSELGRYLSEEVRFDRLAAARRVLWDAVDNALARDDVLELEEEVERLASYWEVPRLE